MNGFNKALQSKVITNSLEQREASILRNKQREAAFSAFKLDQLATQKELNELHNMISDPNIPMETRHALEQYYEALRDHRITSKDKTAFFGPVQDQLLRSVPYDSFNNALKNLAFVNKAGRNPRRHR